MPIGVGGDFSERMPADLLASREALFKDPIHKIDNLLNKNTNDEKERSPVA